MDWAYKAALTATTVALLLLVAQRFDRRMAGLLAGLPTVTGPALLWLALEFGNEYVIQAAAGAVAASAMCAVFAWVYDCMSRRGSAVAALVAAVIASALAAVALRGTCTGVVVALALAAATCVLVVFVLQDDVESASSVRRLRGELALTALASGAVSGLVAASAMTVGPFWAGVLASPPLIAAAIAVHQQLFAGHASVRRFLRGYVAGLLGRAVFAAAFAALLTTFGASTAALLAAALGSLLSAAVMRWIARPPVYTASARSIEPVRTGRASASAGRVQVISREQCPAATGDCCKPLARARRPIGSDVSASKYELRSYMQAPLHGMDGSDAGYAANCSAPLAEDGATHKDRLCFTQRVRHCGPDAAAVLIRPASETESRS